MANQPFQRRRKNAMVDRVPIAIRHRNFDMIPVLRFGSVASTFQADGCRSRTVNSLPGYSKVQQVGANESLAIVVFWNSLMRPLGLHIQRILLEFFVSALSCKSGDGNLLGEIRFTALA
jgi:hypothetical protein